MTKEKIAGQFKKLKEAKGPVPEELRKYVASQNKAQKAILNALKEGPKSVPELAEECDLATDKVLWYVTGLRKYGKVADVPGRVAYPKFTLTSGEAR